MGRTNPTFRDALRAIEGRWGTYRRALRRRDQPRFDRLFVYARAHADASGLLNHQNPLFPALLSVDLEQEGRLDDFEDRLDGFEDRLDEHDDRLDDFEGRLAKLEETDESSGNAVDERSGRSVVEHPGDATGD